MSQLSKYLNQDSNKVRIGFSDLDGYEQALKTLADTRNKINPFRGEQVIGGFAGVGSVKNMTVQVKDNNPNFIANNDLKQVICKVNIAYSFPISHENTYHMATTELGNGGGLLDNRRIGIPRSFDGSTIEALKSELGPSKNIHGGIGLCLSKWGKDYLDEFFKPHDWKARELQLLVQYNLLCAEVVLHQQSVGASGKVFYANVVDSLPDKGYLAYFSPMFGILPQFSNLNLEIEAHHHNQTEQIILGKGGYEAAGNYEYDYKTGEIKGLTPNTLSGMAAIANSSGTIDITTQTSYICRIRLFVPKDKEAEACRILRKNKLPNGFTEVNSEIEYSGGKTVTTDFNASLTGTPSEIILFYAERVMKLFSETGVVYETGGAHTGLVNVEKAPEGLWATATIADKNQISIVPKSTTQRNFGDGSDNTHPTCDCSGFVSLVLINAGITDTVYTSLDYKNGSIKLKQGYRLEQLNKPEPGCICYMWTEKHGNHVAIAANDGVKCWGFGKTSWVRQYIPAARLERMDRGQFSAGKADQPYNKLANFSHFWKIVRT